jgi:hypothetical protein
MLNPFEWIRRRTQESVMAGVGDALEELANGTVAEVQVALVTMNQRLSEPVEIEHKKEKAKK